MPLKINLYHEVIRARHEEQYDPLRLSMIGLVVIISLLAAYYFIALVGKASVENALAAKQKEWNALQPQVKAAAAEEEVLNKQLGLARKMKTRMENRFYWGPVFEQVVSVVPGNVQLTRFNGDISPEATRRCQMTVEGIAAGHEPRQVAEELRVRLIERLAAKYVNVTATFRTLEDAAEKVNYGGERLGTANFNISVTFLPKATPEPTPAPAKGKAIAKQNHEAK